MSIKTRPLVGLVSIEPRFARSVNLTRDLNTPAIDGYIPTGRTIEIVARVARAMREAPAGRALSITGPYGSGKSSAALFISALAGPD